MILGQDELTRITHMAVVSADEKWIVHVATSLGIRVEVAPRIALSDGQSVQPWARVIDFGAANGMLIFAEWAECRDHAEELTGAGYGFSTFREPPNSPPADFSSVQEMLCDWTWTGPSSLKPDWVV